MGKRLPDVHAKHRFVEYELSSMLFEATCGMVSECWYEPLAERGREVVRMTARPDGLHVQTVEVGVEGCTLWQIAEKAVAAVGGLMDKGKGKGTER